MRIGFFGDSFTAGAEAGADLNAPYGTATGLSADRPEFAFPSYFDNSINLGTSGGSNDFFVDQLVANLTNIDVAVFCLTDANRRLYYDQDLCLNGMRVNEKQFGDNGGIGDMLSEEISRLSNDTFDDYQCSRICALLYLLCIANNIKPYFVNVFCSQLGKSQLWNIIPEDCWIIPKNQCILNYCCNDTNSFVENPSHFPFSFRDWLDSNNEDVKKYIRPCDYHFNKSGHKVVADFLKKRIDLK